MYVFTVHECSPVELGQQIPEIVHIPECVYVSTPCSVPTSCTGLPTALIVFLIASTFSWLSGYQCCTGGLVLHSIYSADREQHVQLDLTYPHTSVSNEVADKMRELDHNFYPSKILTIKWYLSTKVRALLKGGGLRRDRSMAVRYEMSSWQPYWNENITVEIICVCLCVCLGGVKKPLLRTPTETRLFQCAQMRHRAI